MKRILVPTDFSPTSERAFRFAVDIASRAAGTVILYHIYTPLETTFAGTVKTREIYNTQSETNLLKRLQRLRKKVFRVAPEVPVSTVVGYSPVVDNILGFAEHNNADLIVMGTQGASGLKRVIVGSTTAHIIEKSNVPVLAIPEKFKWKEPKQIVFATDIQRAERKALSITMELAKLYAAKVTIVHLADSFVTGEDQQKQAAELEVYTQTLQNTYGNSNLNFQFLKTPSFYQTMDNLHVQVPYDMLVMVRRKKSFLERFLLESFTKNRVYTTTLPLLVAPEED